MLVVTFEAVMKKWLATSPACISIEYIENIRTFISTLKNFQIGTEIPDFFSTICNVRLFPECVCHGQPGFGTHLP